MLLSFDDPGVEELFCVDDAVTSSAVRRRSGVKTALDAVVATLQQIYF